MIPINPFGDSPAGLTSAQVADQITAQVPDPLPANKGGSGSAVLSYPLTGTLATTQAASPRLAAWDTGSAIYVRMAWNATYDLVVKLVRDSGTNSHNMNFQELGILLKTTASTGTPTLTIIESFNDDTTGYLTAANGRFGGNHLAETVELTKSAHGITSASIGKRYQDTNARKYAITRIISSSVIEVIPEGALSVLDPTGTKTLPPSSTTLTGLDGLSDLTGWTAGYAAAGPGMNGLVQQFLIDGQTLVPYGPALTGNKFEIVEYHQAPNLKGAYAYFVSTGSSATWANAGKMWDRVTRTTFHPWGQLEVEEGCLLAYETRFSEANPLQFNPLLGLSGATNMHVWVPGTTSITFTGSTVNSVSNPMLNFNAPVFIGGTCSGSDIAMETSSHSALSGGVFPDFVVQLTSSSTSSHSGWTASHLAGLDPTYGEGVPSAHLISAKEWFRMQLSSRKIYAPQMMSKDATFAAGTSFQHRAFRRWQPPPASSPVDYWTFVKAGEKWLVYAAWTTNPGAFTLTLPGYLANLAASLVRGHNASLTSATSTGGSIIITPSSANGHAIIRLG